MKSLVDNLVLTCDEVLDTSETVSIIFTNDNDNS